MAAEAATAWSYAAAAAARSRAAASAVPSGAAARARSAAAADMHPLRQLRHRRSRAAGLQGGRGSQGGEAVAVGAEELRLQPGVRHAVHTAELRELSLQLSVEVHCTDIWTGLHFAANGSVVSLWEFCVVALSLQYSCVLETIEAGAEF